MCYRKSEEITECAKIHTDTIRRRKENALRAYIHTFTTTEVKILPNVSKLINLPSKKTKISPHVPIFKYNSIEPLDVPMFHIRIVQVKRRSITLHAYTPKDSTEPLDVPMFHIQNVQVKRGIITTHAYIPRTITIASNHELLQEELISEQYNNPYHIVQSYK